MIFYPVWMAVINVMEIAVIIPVRDRSDPLRRAIASVMEQTSPVQEIVVVDDGSEISDPKETLNGLSDDRLTLLRQPPMGVSAARNLGIKASKSPWVALLDSDDHWLPEKIAKQRDFHAANPDCLISQTDEVWIRNGAHVNPCFHHRKPSGDMFEPSLERCLISPSAVLMSRALLDDIGLFDPTMPACEDYDLWLRVTSRYQVGLVPEKLMIKTGGHPDQLSQKHWGMDRFRIKALRKILDGGQLTPEQRWAALQVLASKLSILEAGSRKRGKKAEAENYRELRDYYTNPKSENLTLFPDDAL
jgi:glycosyltransferase involved in cell wall biosynthesis